MVTGASGFVGAVISELLLSDTRQAPCVLINSTSPGIPWRLRNIWAQLCVHEGNLLDPMAITRTLAPHPPTHVIHGAAFTHAGRSWARPSECFAVNAIGTQNLIDAVAPYRPTFTYISTSEVYGTVGSGAIRHLRPQSPYAASKLAGEFALDCAQEAGRVASARIARVYNLFGPKQWPDRIIPEAIIAALRDRDLYITSGSQKRDFVYVIDAARAVISLALSDELIEHQVVDIASGIDRSVRDVAATVFRQINTVGSLVIGAAEDRPNELLSTSGEDSDLRHLLTGELTDFHAALDLTITWYRDHLDVFP